MPEPTADMLAPSRALQAYRSHSFGMTWAEAAQDAGYPTPDAARKAAARLIRRTENEGVEDVRRLVGTRLEQMFMIIAPRIKDGDLEAMDRGLEITKQFRALMGVDAPVASGGSNEPPVVIEVQVGVMAAI